ERPTAGDPLGAPADYQPRPPTGGPPRARFPPPPALHVEAHRPRSAAAARPTVTPPTSRQVLTNTLRPPQPKQSEQEAQERDDVQWLSEPRPEDPARNSG